MNRWVSILAAIVAGLAACSGQVVIGRDNERLDPPDGGGPAECGRQICGRGERCCPSSVTCEPICLAEPSCAPVRCEPRPPPPERRWYTTCPNPECDGGAPLPPPPTCPPEGSRCGEGDTRCGPPPPACGVTLICAPSDPKLLDCPP